jgi:TldD protein
MSNRRSFVKALSAAAAAASARSVLLPDVLPGIDKFPRAGDSIIDELASRALEAAKSAGATYADVRITVTRNEDVYAIGGPGGIWDTSNDFEDSHLGVRALADGAWGFAASTVWTNDEAARLGREAAIQAKSNARGRKRRIELGEPPAPVKGTWSTPIKRDPFTVSLSEKLDVLWALNETVARIDTELGATGTTYVRHRRQEKTFVSTDGASVTQTTWLSHPYFAVGMRKGEKGFVSRSYDRLQPAGGGWEVMTAPHLASGIPEVVEQAIMMLDAEPVDPERYDVLLDGYATAALVGRTIGVAAELDRVLGYEANAGGTSYLAPPDDMLGKFALGPKLLNVSANRSRPGGVSTIKWDDEGTEPHEYQLIKDGVIVDYHTTRDLAGELSAWYGASGQRVRSHGGAASENAGDITTVIPPNVEMLAGATDVGMEEMIAGMDSGLVMYGGGVHPDSLGCVTVDRQQLNGEINANMVFEVKKGKRTRFISGSEVLFRSPEMWKGLKAIGGGKSRVHSGSLVKKGEPSQAQHFGTSAVPGVFTRVAVTNRMRKA